MKQEKISVIMKNGLHARPASQLVQLANSFDSNIIIKTDNKNLDCKSILCLMSSGIKENDEIFIEAIGDDEEEAIKKIVTFFTTTK
ncbi:MAG: HPr family phosphocarrier protein [Bacillota bacterium]|nr:HPr family phosphocarrier protein [Bacillota bacterium]